MLDQNLVTAQWGLLSVFGVVVALLIPQAARYLDAYLQVGTTPAYDVARKWERNIRRLTWGVLGAVIILSLVGLYDVGVVSFVSRESAITAGARGLWIVVDWERSRALMWVLLVLAPLAQGVFVWFVAELVDPVPPPAPLPFEAGGDLRWSTTGVPTVIYFGNETPTPVKLEWINTQGGFRDYDPIPAAGPDHQGRSQRTFVGHRWRLTRADGRVDTVTAVRNPGQVVIR